MSITIAVLVTITLKPWPSDNKLYCYKAMHASKITSSYKQNNSHETNKQNHSHETNKQNNSHETNKQNNSHETNKQNNRLGINQIT